MQFGCRHRRAGGWVEAERIDSQHTGGQGCVALSRDSGRSSNECGVLPAFLGVPLIGIHRHKTSRAQSVGRSDIDLAGIARGPVDTRAGQLPCDRSGICLHWLGGILGRRRRHFGPAGDGRRRLFAPRTTPIPADRRARTDGSPARTDTGGGGRSHVDRLRLSGRRREGQHRRPACRWRRNPGPGVRWRSDQHERDGAGQHGCGRGAHSQSPAVHSFYRSNGSLTRPR